MTVHANAHIAVTVPRLTCRPARNTLGDLQNILSMLDG